MFRFISILIIFSSFLLADWEKVASTASISKASMESGFTFGSGCSGSENLSEGTYDLYFNNGGSGLSGVLYLSKTPDGKYDGCKGSSCGVDPDDGRVYDPETSTCSCPGSLELIDGVCKCPIGKEQITPKKCPCNDGDTCDYPPMCVDPCPDGTQRNGGGGCCPIGKISYCDTSAQSWLCRCPYDQAEINGTCTICDGSYPNADSSDCSNCPPYYETLDGMCSDVPCSDEAPFYYPVSESSTFIITGADEYCYTAGDNSNTGTDSTGSSDNNNTNGGDSGDTGSGSDNNTTDGTNDNNSSSGSSGSGGSSSGSSGTGFSDEGIINQLRENKTVEESIKTSVDGVKTSVDNVKNTLDQTNNKLDSIKGAVDETNNKLDSIKNLLDSNVTFSFDNLAEQTQTFFEKINESFETIKTDYEQVKGVVTGEKTFTFPTGTFSGFDFSVWGEEIFFDPCPMLIKLRPFITMLVESMLVFWSVFIVIWGFKS